MVGEKEGLELRTESYSQGSQVWGGRHSRSCCFPREVDYFNPRKKREREEEARRKGLREKEERDGRGEDGGKGGRGREKEGEQETGAREGRAGEGTGRGSLREGHCAARAGPVGLGKPAGVSGRGLDVEGACHALPEPLWFLSQSP